MAGTEKFYTKVQEIIHSRFNKKFDLSLEAKMMGKKAIKSARVFAQETDISDSLSTKEFLVECEPMFQTCFLQMSSCQVTLTNMLLFSKISNIY